MTDAAATVHQLSPEAAEPEADSRTIHERMAAILAELPAIGKNQRNQAQNFNFRGIDDVLNALNPLLAQHGVFYLPEVLERSTSERQISNNRVMFEVSLHVRYTFFGLAGDSVVASTWGEGTDMGDKSTPKAMTSAMKSALFQAFAISTEETADPDHGSPEESSGTRRRGRQQQQEPDPPQEPETLADAEDVQALRDRIDALPDEQKAALKQRWADLVSLRSYRLDNLPARLADLVRDLVNGAEAQARAAGEPAQDRTGATERAQQAPPPGEPSKRSQEALADAPPVEQWVRDIEEKVRGMSKQEVAEHLETWSLPKGGSDMQRRKRIAVHMVKDHQRSQAAEAEAK